MQLLRWTGKQLWRGMAATMGGLLLPSFAATVSLPDLALQHACRGSVNES